MRRKNRSLFGAYLTIAVLLLEGMSAALFFIGEFRVSAAESDTTAAVPSSDAPPEEFQKQSADQAEALAAAEVLMESFGRDELLQPLYPEEYAGLYLDEEGNLNLLLTDLEGETRKKCETLLAEWSHKIQYHKADYSYQQLSQIYEYIGTECLDLEIVCYGINQRRNEAFVEVLEEDIEKLRERLKEEGAPAIPIRVEKSEGIIAVSGTAEETEQVASEEGIERESIEKEDIERESIEKEDIESIENERIENESEERTEGNEEAGKENKRSRGGQVIAVVMVLG